MIYRKDNSHKYKHLYSKGRLAFFNHFSLLEKFLVILLLLSLVAVTWLTLDTMKWKVSKKKYKAQISTLRSENESLRVEKDLMITRMTLAGLLKPTNENSYDVYDDDEDAGFTETLGFTNFKGSYNAASGQLQFGFKITNIVDGADRVEGRLFVVLGEETVPLAEIMALPVGTDLLSNGQPDGTQGGVIFNITDSNDIVFNVIVKKSDQAKYNSGVIYVFATDGTLLQMRRIDFDFNATGNIILE